MPKSLEQSKLSAYLEVMSTDQTPSDIYNEGWIAFCSDQVKENPYAPGSHENECWEDGWFSAEKQRQTDTWPWGLLDR